MPESNTTPQKPASTPSLTGLTKRRQLEKTNKNIFIWVAVVAAIVALSLVALQFLVRQGLFNNKIITAQQKTNKTLEDNKKNFVQLKENVDALLANESLSALRVNETDSSLQVILDALPTSGDTTSFSNSLYNKVLQKRGASVEGASVGTGAAGAVVAVDPAAQAVPAAAGSAAQPLAFQATIVGTQQQVTDTLRDIEKVIRPMVLKNLNIVANGDGQVRATFQGETYFLPRSSIKLGSQTIKP